MINTEESVPNIANWLEGQSIFITGASGFIGKVLLEKLLRDSPGIKDIYVLLRTKKGKGCEERVNALCQSSVFNILKTKNPEMLKKIKGIPGDGSAENLGISDSDRRILQENVSVVFHAAASVKFDDPLAEAIAINTRCTREVVYLAKGMKKLQILVYVSTAYTNCDHKTIEEKIYEPKMDWAKMIKAAETMDERKLNAIQDKLLGECPNTYIFSKNLAERIVYEHRHEIPVCVYRPTVVASAAVEPEPGWIDTLNSPLAIIGASGKGVLRVHGGPFEVNTDYIAVDTAVNGMIAAAWYHACYLPRMPHKATEKEEKMVYNATSVKMNTQQIAAFGMKIVDSHPMADCLWKVYFMPIPNQTLFLLGTIFFHFLPGLVYDVLLKFAGKKISLCRIYRNIYITSVSLKTFMYNEWDFKKKNFDELVSKLRPEDQPLYLTECLGKVVSINDYLDAAEKGLRVLFREPKELTKEKLDHYKRVCMLDTACRVILVGVLLYLLPLETIWKTTQDAFSYIYSSIIE